MFSKRAHGRKPLNIARINGAEINYLGSLDSPSMLVFIGRNNSEKRSTSIDLLIHELHRMGMSVCWYESKSMQTSQFLAARYEEVCKTRFIQFFKYKSIFDTLFKIMIKSCILLAHPKRWDYFLRAKLLGRRYLTHSDLGAFLRTLVSKNVYLISHSAGGIAASSIESERQIKAMVCFGYPFKHPERAQEPYRTKHLATLKKPFLIIQGSEDEYGTSKDALRYALSPSIQIASILSRHDYDNLSGADFNKILTLLQDFFGLSHKDYARPEQLITPKPDAIIRAGLPQHPQSNLHGYSNDSSK